MMRLVEDDEVVGFGDVEQFSLPVSSAHEMAGNDNDGFLMPNVTTYRPLRMAPHRRRRIPAELLTIVYRPVQIELLPKLDLPLRADIFRGHDEDAPRAAGQPCLPQHQARLDGF